jgi:hypothetical protein
MKNRTKNILYGVLIIIVGLVFVYIFGKVTDMTCSHPEPAVTRCVVEEQLLGVMTVSQKTFSDVNNAKVQSNCDDDGCTYRVALTTTSGQEPLTGYYTSGLPAKENTASQINSYISTGSEEELVINENSGLFAALFSSAFVLLGLYMIIVKGIFNPAESK